MYSMLVSRMHCGTNEYKFGLVRVCVRARKRNERKINIGIWYSSKNKYAREKTKCWRKKNEYEFNANIWRVSILISGARNSIDISGIIYIYTCGAPFILLSAVNVPVSTIMACVAIQWPNLNSQNVHELRVMKFGCVWEDVNVVIGKCGEYC